MHELTISFVKLIKFICGFIMPSCSWTTASLNVVCARVLWGCLSAVDVLGGGDGSWPCGLGELIKYVWHRSTDRYVLIDPAATLGSSRVIVAYYTLHCYHSHMLYFKFFYINRNDQTIDTEG